MNAFDDNWAAPGIANPAEIFPRHHGLFQSSRHIRIQHRPLSGNHDIRKLHQSAIRQKSRQPARLG
jgi:hypothetical protein